MDYLEIANRVRAGIIGRIADGNTNLARLCHYTVLAGNGDNLEIGSLFGGSAITVALAKKESGLAGHVVCIDPLNGYYKDTKSDQNKDVGTDIDISGYTPSPELLMRNAESFGVEIEIIQAKSSPFPKRAKRQYVMAYIDGDHWKDAPTNDWNNIKSLVTRFIVFDNYDKKHPAVQIAVERAKCDPNWALVETENSQAVFERIYA